MNPGSAAEIWLTFSVAVNIALGMVVVVGSIWSAFREIHIRDQAKELAENLDAVASGYAKVTQMTDLIVARIADMHQLSRDERRELIDWLREQKRDQVALLVDIERRLTHVIDRNRDGRGGDVINQFSGGSAASNQAGNIQNERR